VEVRLSPWLLVCTGLLALFLALGKRRAELVLVERLAQRGRPVLDGYSTALVDQLLTAVASATIAAYAVYALTARDTRWLAVTIPFVVFGSSLPAAVRAGQRAGESSSATCRSSSPSPRGRDLRGDLVGRQLH
jgi:hypothetical protein